MTQAAAPQKPDILARIEAYKRQEIATAKEQVAPSAIRKLARQASQPREFASAIERHLSGARPALMQKSKRQAPPKG